MFPQVSKSHVIEDTIMIALINEYHVLVCILADETVELCSDRCDSVAVSDVYNIPGGSNRLVCIPTSCGSLDGT